MAKLFQPKQLTLAIGLRDDITLASFYSEGNEQLVATITHCAQGKGEPFIYIWGHPGAGRSHLLQAACYEADDHGLVASYIPLAELADYGPAILEDLHQVDLLCLDDIQVIAGQSDWEQALFYLFNQLRDADKKLLVTADIPPRGLGIKLADLSSRLSWGLVYQMPTMDDKLKAKVLQHRARARGIELVLSVANYILTHSPKGRIDELFKLLNQLDEASIAAKRKITIPFVRQVLGW